MAEEANTTPRYSQWEEAAKAWEGAGNAMTRAIHATTALLVLGTGLYIVHGVVEICKHKDATAPIVLKEIDE